MKEKNQKNIQHTNSKENKIKKESPLMSQSDFAKSNGAEVAKFINSILSEDQKNNRNRTIKDLIYAHFAASYHTVVKKLNREFSYYKSSHQYGLDPKKSKISKEKVLDINQDINLLEVEDLNFNKNDLILNPKIKIDEEKFIMENQDVFLEYSNDDYVRVSFWMSKKILLKLENLKSNSQIFKNVNLYRICSGIFNSFFKMKQEK